MKQEIYDTFSILFLLNPKNWFAFPFGQCVVQLIGREIQIHYIQILLIRFQLAVDITEPFEMPIKTDGIESVRFPNANTDPLNCTHCGKNPFPIKSFCNSCGKQDPFKFE